MTVQATVFPALSRGLHWLMAAMVLAMLFIGVGMVTTPDHYHALLAIHRPLGASVLLLAALRLVNRQLNPPPPLPEGMPGWLRLSASASHVALYGLMFAVPLVGWAMLSAGGFPVQLYGALRLPPILPQDAPLFAVLRRTHTVLAFALFATFLVHVAAALAHAFLFRDGVFQSMASLKPTPGRGAPQRATR